MMQSINSGLILLETPEEYEAQYGGFSETSMEAYRSLENINQKQFKVYNTIQQIGEATNSMIAEHLGWTINRVTPRCLELRKMGFVKLSKIDFCPINKRRAKFWRIWDKQK